MRKLKLENWNEKNSEGKETPQNLINIFEFLIANQDQRTMLKGFDKFRMFSKLDKVFEKAKETGTLEFEDAEYVFLKNIVEANVPAQWAFNKEFLKHISNFMELKSE